MVGCDTLIHRNSKVVPCVKLSQWCNSCRLCADQVLVLHVSSGKVALEREGSPPAVLNHNEDVIGTLGDIMEIELLKQLWGCHGEHVLSTECRYLQAGLRDLALILSHIQIRTHTAAVCRSDESVSVRRGALFPLYETGRTTDTRLITATHKSAVCLKSLNSMSLHTLCSLIQGLSHMSDGF